MNVEEQRDDYDDLGLAPMEEQEEEPEQGDDEAKEKKGEKPVPKNGYRRWVFTLNNPERELVEDPDSEWLMPCGLPVFFGEARKEKKINALVVSVEYAPTTGTEHLQGYMETKSQATLSALLKWRV